MDLIRIDLLFTGILLSPSFEHMQWSPMSGAVAIRWHSWWRPWGLRIHLAELNREKGFT